MCIDQDPHGGNSIKSNLTLICALIIFLTGCTAIGPRSVPRDRFDHNTAIADSWKQQTLLNIVKLRYADMPLFVEVASVVSGYTLEGTVNLNGTVSSGMSGPGDYLTLGTSGRYTDRPTITYAPITGEKFNQSFMTPIPPKSILFLMQSQWPAEMILPITLSAVNGLRAEAGSGRHPRSGDPDFYRVIALVQEIQASGAVGLRVVRGAEGQETTLLFFYRDHLSPNLGAPLGELERILGLKPGVRELKVTYGNVPETDREIALQTRSMLQIMIALAAEIEVPAAHVADGLTLADHTLQAIARPNNDTLYVAAMVDVTEEPIVMEMPAFDSKYVSLMVTGYDHYVNIPMSTGDGDFGKSSTILFYSERTPDYDGSPVEGVDKVFEVSGDFVSAALRVMPHAAEPECLKANLAAMKRVELKPLSVFLGKKEGGGENLDFKAKQARFPAFGSDFEIFEDRFLEVMQFVVNHTTFDSEDELDVALLKILKTLGVEPGKEFDPDAVADIDGEALTDSSSPTIARNTAWAKMRASNWMRTAASALSSPPSNSRACRRKTGCPSSAAISTSM